uniref:NADH-ubiquinone oxidoreductase chain 2 n=1 Tax=Encyrtus infelix TaxID=355422 RepID=A0A411FRG4_9HYME|nr:NADH dehydrogenase subunit 2 [Encyrtus infelix]QBA96080.1 NADH dehydrogenase subunit 2 [Encyrtus infelix]QBA96093.1 NADH dehydrogenase subunit 2 [Encyrtus infelix]
MNLFYYLISLPLIMTSNIMIFLLNNSFYMWMIMEMNLIGFISFLMTNKMMSQELTMTYFLIQSFNSYLFLMSMITMKIKMMTNLPFMMIIFSMFSKMGMPPFHLWYLKFMKSLNWNLFIVNSTIQKMIPLYVIKTFMKMSMTLILLMIMSLLSLMIMPIFAMKEYSLKLILSYSSMIQISWIIMVMTMNNKTWILFFMVYSICSFALVEMFKKLNMNYLFELAKSNSKLNLWATLLILSISGLPPFLGFASKFMFFNNMNLMNTLTMNVLILMFSMLNFYFYMKISIKVVTMFSLNNKMILMNKNSTLKMNKLYLMMIFSLMMSLLYEMF